MMTLYQRLTLEWQALDIAYPQWVSTLVMDDVNYVVTLVVMSLACFEVGMIMGFILVVV